MAALPDEDTRNAWLKELPGFPCSRYAQLDTGLAVLSMTRLAITMIASSIVFLM
jgi:hypothetical protein